MPVPLGTSLGRYARRAGSAGDKTVLPTACDLPAPTIPAGREWSDHEHARWAQLWSSPQANMWDESCVGMVAALVVYESLIMADRASAWTAAEARHAYEQLGLTPRAMVALGWVIGDE
ncbi:hypothetical protein [Streptomyces chilikensis]|uniref:hypothetical protein n=1 Tax=Streptomyces chilikensis TaxID=1194079 RepID=UPI000AE3EB94|nr:hypothetical protein [Streptomyces chilikensis]